MGTSIVLSLALALLPVFLVGAVLFGRGSPPELVLFALFGALVWVIPRSVLGIAQVVSLGIGIVPLVAVADVAGRLLVAMIVRAVRRALDQLFAGSRREKQLWTLDDWAGAWGYATAQLSLGYLVFVPSQLRGPEPLWPSCAMPRSAYLSTLGLLHWILSMALTIGFLLLLRHAIAAPVRHRFWAVLTCAGLFLLNSILNLVFSVVPGCFPLVAVLLVALFVSGLTFGLFRKFGTLTQSHTLVSQAH